VLTRLGEHSTSNGQVGESSTAARRCVELWGSDQMVMATMSGKSHACGVEVPTRFLEGGGREWCSVATEAAFAEKWM